MSSMAKVQELQLGIPVADGEPRPWVVQIWVYGGVTDYPFVTREDAVDYAVSRYRSDDCAVGDILSPTGEIDASARSEAWDQYLRRPGW